MEIPLWHQEFIVCGQAAKGLVSYTGKLLKHLAVIPFKLLKKRSTHRSAFIRTVWVAAWNSIFFHPKKKWWMDKLRINVILPFPATKPVGGAKIMYEYANRLTDRGHEVTIYHSIKRPFKKNHPHLPGSKTHIHPARRGKAQMVSLEKQYPEPDCSVDHRQVCTGCRYRHQHLVADDIRRFRIVCIQREKKFNLIQGMKSGADKKMQCMPVTCCLYSIL